MKTQNRSPVSSANPEPSRVWCRIPDSLVLDDLLRAYPPSLHPFRRDVVGALSEYMFRRAAVEGNVDDWGFVRLRSSHMQVLHDNYSEYVSWMRDAGLWIQDRSYEAGKRSRGYRWSGDYIGKSRTILLADPVVIKAMERLRSKRVEEYASYRSQSVEDAVQSEIFYFRHIVDPVGFRRENHQLMLSERGISDETYRWFSQKFKEWSSKKGSSDAISSCSGVLSSAGTGSSFLPYVRESVPPLHQPTQEEQRLTYGWLQSSLETVRIVEGWEDHARCLTDREVIKEAKYEAIRSCMKALSESIQTGEFEFRVLKTNRRLRTAVTEMPGAGRPFLSLDGCVDLVSWDITCCQPFLTLPLARELEVDERGISRMYAAIQADMYRVIGKHLFGREVSDEERDKIKEPVLKCLYSTNQQRVKLYGADVKEVMQSLFPEVFDVTRTYRDCYDYNEFAILMQQIEADFMIKLVGNELRKAEIPVLTVHDCLIVKRTDAERAGGIIETVGRAYTGFTPLMKEKALTRNP